MVSETEYVYFPIDKRDVMTFTIKVSKHRNEIVKEWKETVRCLIYLAEAFSDLRIIRSRKSAYLLTLDFLNLGPAQEQGNKNHLLREKLLRQRIR